MKILQIIRDHFPPTASRFHAVASSFTHSTRFAMICLIIFVFSLFIKAETLESVRWWICENSQSLSSEKIFIKFSRFSSGAANHEWKIPIWWRLGGKSRNFMSFLLLPCKQFQDVHNSQPLMETFARLYITANVRWWKILATSRMRKRFWRQSAVWKHKQDENDQENWGKFREKENSDSIQSGKYFQWLRKIMWKSNLGKISSGLLRNGKLSSHLFSS